PPRHLPSFPTRRSSDLVSEPAVAVFAPALHPRALQKRAGMLGARCDVSGGGDFGDRSRRGGGNSAYPRAISELAEIVVPPAAHGDRKSTRLNSSHVAIS